MTPKVDSLIRSTKLTNNSMIDAIIIAVIIVGVAIIILVVTQGGK